MKWVWIWDALWIIGGIATWLKRPRVPAALRLTREEEEAAANRRALALVGIVRKR